MSAKQRVISNAGYCHNSTTRPLSQYRQNTIRMINRTDHHVDGTKRLIMPNTSPHPLAIEARRQQLRATSTTYVRTWQIEPARLDQSTDQEDVLPHGMTAIKPGTTNLTKSGVSTEHRCHPNSVAMSPGTEAPHTPCALSMR